MAKKVEVMLSFADDDLMIFAKPWRVPLVFVLAQTLKAIKKHPRMLGWRDWGGAPLSLGLLVCSDAVIRSYNRDYRKMNKATDVLSFPSIEMGSSPAQGTQAGYLGDMIISLETVERAAIRVKRPVTDELVEVFLHGILHLVGFDHVVGKSVTKKHAIEMKSLQAELFAELRPLIKKRYGNFVKKRQRHQRVS